MIPRIFTSWASILSLFSKYMLRTFLFLMFSYTFIFNQYNLDRWNWGSDNWLWNEIKEQRRGEDGRSYVYHFGILQVSLYHVLMCLYLNNILYLVRKYIRISVRGFICSKMRTVFRERSSRKTVNFEEQKRGYCVYCLSKILKRAWKILTNSLKYEAWAVFFWVFYATT